MRYELGELCADAAEALLQGVTPANARARAVALKRHAEHERVRDVVRTVLSQHPCLCHKEGKMVHELRPAVEWDKGRGYLSTCRPLSIVAQILLISRILTSVFSTKP